MVKIVDLIFGKYEVNVEKEFLSDTTSGEYTPGKVPLTIKLNFFLISINIFY